MSNLYRSMEELVGKTPLLELCRIQTQTQLPARILAKLEGFNPGGSAKDRVALAMLEDAEQRGLLPPGTTVIEPTSGNTGIGLCAAAAAKGCKAIIVMPDSMSVERQKLMLGYGAQLVLTPGQEGMTGAVRRAKELADSIPGSFLPGQFENPANAMAHYRTTGPELWADSGETIDAFVAGVGTGGTITGVGRFLKEKDPSIQIVAVEPQRSPLLSQGVAGPHGLQGIGADFVPAVLDRSVIDEIIPVREEDAYAAARAMGRIEGILVGISSGAALHAAMELAKRPEYAGKTIAVLLPDTGERYLSTPLFGDGSPHLPNK